MPTEKPILNFAVDEKLLKRINDFRFDNRIENRSEAIRRLVELGLDVHEQKAAAPAKPSKKR
jgi:metal-responsive CopG/Arc/MetJ family transcriptional regulator